MKKILILSGSPRVNGNSNILCDEFAKGAEKSGHATEKIMVARKKINGCLGCNACMKNDGICIQQDDMNEIQEKMIAADIIVLSSPIYYYTVSAQLKTVMDRCYSFGHNKLYGKDFYYIISCEAPEEKYAKTIFGTLDGFVSCSPESKTKGYVVAYNSHSAGDIKGTAVMEEAFKWAILYKQGS